MIVDVVLDMLGAKVSNDKALRDWEIALGGGYRPTRQAMGWI